MNLNSRIVAPTPLPFELGCCIHSINDCPVMSFFLIVSHCIASGSCPCKRDLCLPCLPFLLYRLLHFHAFKHPPWCISFRYARYTTRGSEARADLTEPQDSVGWTHPEEKRTRWSNRRPGSKSEGPKALLVLTLTQCYPRQAPEHNHILNYSMLYLSIVHLCSRS